MLITLPLPHGASLLVAAAAIATSSVIGVTQSQTIWDGIYSDAQASRGGKLYVQKCATCHGQNLRGNGTTPGIVGQVFSNKWDGKNLSELFDIVSVTMPQDQPGTLTPEEGADILAYMLKMAGAASGTIELSSNIDALKAIQFRANQ